MLGQRQSYSWLGVHETPEEANVTTPRLGIDCKQD